MIVKELEEFDRFPVQTVSNTEGISSEIIY